MTDNTETPTVRAYVAIYEGTLEQAIAANKILPIDILGEMIHLGEPNKRDECSIDYQQLNIDDEESEQEQQS